jgi:uncharacterized membrane protein YphA (DoxX/SURF4 family)
VYGMASIAAGVLDLVWGEFEAAHQPLQAWGDHIPGVTVFAYIAAIWLIAGGAAMLWRRSVRAGAGALAILYGVFILFPLPRFYTAPHFLGYRTAVYIGVVGSVCQQVILFVAAAILWESLSARGSMSRKWALIARWTFGLCSVDFGLAHLTAVETVTPMIPQWMPLGGTFWAVLTGIAFVLAGLGIVSGVLDVLAAKLLGLMLLVFSVVAITPIIFDSPHDHTAWGGNAYNLTAVGAAWIVADWLEARRQSVQNRQSEALAAS